MTTIKRYFVKLFLGRWIATTFALLALLSVVDSLGNADVLPDGSGLGGVLKYAYLRLPALYDRIFMFALLVSLLLTFLSLIRRQELVSFVAAGVSPLMQVRALGSTVVLLTIISAIVLDQTAPPSARALDDWLGVGALSDADIVVADSLWIAEDNAFIEIGSVRGARIFDLAIYHRADRRTISSVTRAASARYISPIWVLEGVETLAVSGSTPPVTTTWITQQSPETLQKLGTSPRNLSVKDQFELSRLTRSGSRPASAYIVWALNRITMPLVAFSFLLIAAPLMQQFGRRQTGDRRLIRGLVIGFSFFIFDGVLKTLAEGGGVTVLSAIGFPLLILLSLGIYMLLESERTR